MALVVTLTPGPGTATILRVAARDGRRAAMSAVVGNSAGVLMWAALSALGVSSLILASQIAYDVLRIFGAGVLIVLGLRSLLHRERDATTASTLRLGRAAGWRSGLVTSASSPKLAVFSIALFSPAAPDTPTDMCCPIGAATDARGSGLSLVDRTEVLSGHPPGLLRVVRLRSGRFVPAGTGSRAARR